MDDPSLAPEAHESVNDLGVPRNEDLPPQRFVVVHQVVDLDIHFREKRLSGRTEILLQALGQIDEVALDARQCVIDLDNITVECFRDGISSGAKQTQASHDDTYSRLLLPPRWGLTAAHHDIRRLRMLPIVQMRSEDLPTSGRDNSGCTPVDGSLKIKIPPKEVAPPERPKLIIRKSQIAIETPVTGAASSSAHSSDFALYKIVFSFTTSQIRDGLHFVGVDPGDMRFPHVYSRHSIEPGTVSCIFPCVDDYGARSDWRISLKMPRTLGHALEQALVTQQPSNETTAQAHDRHYTLAEKDKLLEMTAVCSGRLTDEVVDPDDPTKKIITFESQRASSAQKMGFAIGPFEHVDLWSAFRTEDDDEQLGANALKIHGYCLPGRADLVRNTCAAIAAAADFFTMTFATYPYDSFKICFIDDMIRDTEPLQSLTLASNRLLYPAGIIDPEIDVTRTIVSSLASQWSGVHLVANQRADLWLVIGIALFMTELFMKRLCGNNEYRFRLKSLSDRLVELDVQRPSLHDLGRHLHLGDFEYDFMALKAPLVLFILDRRLAKATGTAGLSKVISKLLVKANIQDSDAVIATEPFRRSCERGGKHKLDAFWSQWVYGSGCPRLKVTQRFNKKRLCIEMTLRQVHELDQQQQQQQRQPPQHGRPRRPIDKRDFLRLVRESLHDVKGGPTQPLFTGPMTIRIHEADGTPYEHIVEIREETHRVTKFEIPYNTKYKRLKRTRRQKERQNAGINVDAHGDHADDALMLYCLGDVLQGPEDMTAWELHEWDADVEKKMDQESYEWIRMDADFEWIASITTNLESYMYVSQLQQDRDVAAQQDSMVFLASSPRHPLVSTILTRTVVDRRYYHGIRTMAAELLPRHANIDALPLLGFRHLLKIFSELFCYPGTQTPRPNDFTDKKQYVVQGAVVRAIASVRDKDGRCPEEGKRFILNQLLVNNNDDNPYLDHHYVALLLEALATAFIPDGKKEDAGPSFEEGGGIQMNMGFDDADDDDDDDVGGGGGSMDLDFIGTTTELADGVPSVHGGHAAEKMDPLLAAALELFDRYRKRDEWEQSYGNVWTIATLDGKLRLMKAGVIPVSGVEFLQYLQDGTHDRVRIKAFEALVELGLFLVVPVFRFFVCSLSTDRSPFVRDRLIKAFCTGIAALALDDLPKPDIQKANTAARVPSSELIVTDSNQMIEDRKASHLRRENLQEALAALKREMKTHYSDRLPEYQKALEAALESPVLGRYEVEVLLEICSMLFDEAERFIITLRYPKRWQVLRSAEASHPGKLLVTFKSHYDTSCTAPKPSLLPLEPSTASNGASSLASSAVGPSAKPSLPLPQKRKSIILKTTGAGTKIITRPSMDSTQAPHNDMQSRSKAAILTDTTLPEQAATKTEDIPSQRDKKEAEKNISDKLGDKVKLTLSKSASVLGDASLTTAKTAKRSRSKRLGSDLDSPTPPSKKVKSELSADPLAVSAEAAIPHQLDKERCMVKLVCKHPSRYPNIFPPSPNRSSLNSTTRLKDNDMIPAHSKNRRPLPDAVPSSRRSLAVASKSAASPKSLTPEPAPLGPKRLRTPSPVPAPPSRSKVTIKIKKPPATQ